MAKVAFQITFCSANLHDIFRLNAPECKLNHLKHASPPSPVGQHLDLLYLHGALDTFV